MAKLVPLCAVVLLLSFGNTLLAADPPKPPKDDDDEVKLPALLKAKPLKPDPKDDELRKLLKERYNVALDEMNLQYKLYEAGSPAATLDIVFESGERVVSARLELCDQPADKIPILVQLVEMRKEIEKIAKARFDAGRIAPQDFARARYFRLDAEIQLLRAKRAAEKK
jgi:hypothetical protein